LFWGISFLGPREKLERRGLKQIVGVCLLRYGHQYAIVLKGLDLSTRSIVQYSITITPILVVQLSAHLIKEKSPFRRKMGFGPNRGIGLILFGAEIRQDASQIPWRNMLLLLNATSL